MVAVHLAAVGILAIVWLIVMLARGTNEAFAVLIGAAVTYLLLYILFDGARRKKYRRIKAVAAAMVDLLYVVIIMVVGASIFVAAFIALHTKIGIGPASIIGLILFAFVVAALDNLCE